MRHQFRTYGNNLDQAVKAYNKLFIKVRDTASHFRRIDHDLSRQLSAAVPTTRYILYQIGYPSPYNYSSGTLSEQFIDSIDESLESIKTILDITNESIKKIGILQLNSKDIHDTLEDAIDHVGRTITNSKESFNKTESGRSWNLFGSLSSQRLPIFELEDVQIELKRISQYTIWRLENLKNFQAKVLKKIQQKAAAIHYELVDVASEARQYQGQESNNKRERDIINAAYQWRRSLTVLEDAFRNKEEEMKLGRLS